MSELLKTAMRSGLLLLLLLVPCAGCTDRQAGLTTYHEALELMDAGDAPAALEKLQQAAGQARTDSLRALVASQMGTLYFSQRLLHRALACYRQAYAIDLAARDTVGLIYDLRDMGNVLRATDDRADSCLAYFQEARRLAVSAGHANLLRDVESQLAAYHLWRNHLAEARRLLQPVMQAPDSSRQGGQLFMMADFYHRSGWPDSAAVFYRQLLTRGNVYTQRAAHRALAEYCMAGGETDEARHHLRQYELFTDSLHRENEAEAMHRMAALYDYTLHQQAAHRLRLRLMLAVGGLLLLSVLLVALLLWFSRRRLQYKLRVERLEQLLERYRRQDGQGTAQRQSSIVATPIGQHIDRLLTDIQPQAMTDADFHQLEEAVEQFHPGFLSRLQEFCRLTPQERRVCLLLKLGTAPAAIAQLTAHSRQSVTNTRSRLYRKAFGRQGTPAAWDEFVRSLA